MKRILFPLFVFSFQLSTFSSASAQRTPIEKYEIAPASYEHVFLDHVEYFPCRTINVTDNQYLGQVDKNEKLYGYGMFINSFV